jgi:hypothetical protein
VLAKECIQCGNGPGTFGDCESALSGGVPPPLRRGTLFVSQTPRPLLFLALALLFRFGPARGLGLRLPLRLNVVEALLYRLDQTLGVGAESLMRQTHCIPSCQWLQRCRQIFRPRHLRLADQNRNDALALVERRGDFDTHKIVRVIKAAIAVCVRRIDPTFADDGKHDVAFGHPFIEHTNEIKSGRDVVDVQKKLLRVKYVLQPVKQPPRVARIIATAIIDENFACHCRKTPRVV